MKLVQDIQIQTHIIRQQGITPTMVLIHPLLFIKLKKEIIGGVNYNPNCLTVFGLKVYRSEDCDEQEIIVT